MTDNFTLTPDEQLELQEALDLGSEDTRYSYRVREILKHVTLADIRDKTIRDELEREAVEHERRRQEIEAHYAQLRAKKSRPPDDGLSTLETKRDDGLREEKGRHAREMSELDISHPLYVNQVDYLRWEHAWRLTRILHGGPARD